MSHQFPMQAGGEVREAVNMFLRNPLTSVFQRQAHWSGIVCRENFERTWHDDFAGHPNRYALRLLASQRAGQLAAVNIDNGGERPPHPDPLPQEPPKFDLNSGLKIRPTRIFYAKIDNWPHTFPAKFIADAYSRLPRERPPTTFEYERSFLSVLERLGFNPAQHARRNNANWSIPDVTTWLSSQFPGALLLFEELHKLAGRFLGKLDGLSPADLNIRYHHLRIPSTIPESYPANWLFALVGGSS